VRGTSSDNFRDPATKRMTPGQNCDSLCRITKKKLSRGMSNLGRRELLTGLAAVAVAGVAPAAATSLPAELAVALPLPSAPLACARRAFSPRDLGGALRRLSRFEGSRWVTGWHCHVHTFAHRTLRHLASGLTFATDPRNPANRVSDTVWLVVPEGVEPPPYTSELLLIGHAARDVSVASGVVNYLQRHSGDRRPRPFFYHCEGGQSLYDEEDAPPLPRVERFTDDNI
jgi:hypothetical protein